MPKKKAKKTAKKKAKKTTAKKPKPKRVDEPGKVMYAIMVGRTHFGAVDHWERLRAERPRDTEAEAETALQTYFKRLIKKRGWSGPSYETQEYRVGRFVLSSWTSKSKKCPAK